MLYKVSERVFRMEQEGHKIIKMNLGEPDWPTAPECVDAAIKAIKDGKTRYASAQGEKNLREKLAQYHSCKPEQVVITPGSKYSIYNVINLLVKQGDEVILFSPHWTAFELIINKAGGLPVIVNLSFENSWKLNFNTIESLITSKTRLIIFNNPCNPTSHVWPISDEKKLIELAQKKNIHLLFDCAYRGIAFKLMPTIPYQKNIIICDTFSKTFGMTGWRIGYIVADEKIVKDIVSLNQITITNVPVFIQEAALAALDNYEKLSKRTREESRNRAQACERALKGKVDFNSPGAGFYFFPKTGVDGEKLFEYMLDKHKIAVVPGKAFGNYDQFVRISLCYKPKILEEMCSSLVKSIASLK